MGRFQGRNALYMRDIYPFRATILKSPFIKFVNFLFVAIIKKLSLSELSCVVYIKWAPSWLRKMDSAPMRVYVDV